MNKKVIISFVIAGIVIGGIVYYLYLPQQRSISNQIIKIGLLAPLSGENSNFGYSILKGVQLAKKELGADNFEIILGDSQCDKEKSPAVMKKLIDQNVVAVIGEICSGASLAALPLADQYKIPLISPGSTSPQLSIASDYFFRTVPPDSLQGRYAANLMYTSNYRRLAILYSNEDYGNAFQGVLKENFENLGGAVVADVPFEVNTIDLKEQITEIQKSHPDAIYIVSNSTVSSVAALKMIQDMKIKAALFGSEAMNDKSLLSDADGASEGLIITAVSSGSRSFKQMHRAEFGVDAGLYAPQAYDAFQTIYLALQKGARTGEDIKNMIPSITFDGTSGHIQFDANGEVAGNYEALIVRNQRAEPLQR